MNNWQQVILNEVAEIKLSNVDKKTKEGEKAIRLCNYTDIYKNSFINKDRAVNFMEASCSEIQYEKFILKKGQVAITKDSEKPDDIGIPSYISEDFEDVVLGYHLALFTPFKDRLYGRFLNYWFQTKFAKRYFENNAGGSGQRCTLVLDVIKSTPLYLPSLNTQKQIAKVLADLDAKIEVNNKINQELEAMAKTLYDYWFVQFDFPDANGKPYKSSGGKMFFNEALKREIPVGWEVDNLLNIANITTGRLDSNAEVVDGEYYFYTCAANPTKTDSYAFDDSVILIAGNNAGGNFHVNRFTGKFNAYQRTYIITANEKKYLDYLYQILKGQMKIYKNRGRGSQTKFLTIGMLNNIHIFKPNMDLLMKFSKLTTPMYNKQVNLMKENQKLSALRDWLLPMLMNGQVTIGEVEQKLGMVAEENTKYESL